MTQNLSSEFKTQLEKERLLLEQELSSVGRINPSDPSDWEPSVNRINSETAELEGRASEISEFEDSNAIEVELEKRYREVLAAILRIESNAFGICRICGIAIEPARLHANPAAQTCKIHREE